MAAEPQELRETIDRLYGLPLSEFTAARDAAVKERRSAEDRDGADVLKRLRKPNLVAWGLNQARRSDPEAIERLLEAGDRLANAQRQLVSGGERGLLREAAADERIQVGRVAERAAAELAAAGHAADASTQSKLFATLHAAAANPEVREQLAQGRLVRDHELSDLGLGGEGPAAAATPPSDAQRTREQKDRSAAERRARAVAERLERAKARQAERDEQLEQARSVHRDAERAVRDAAKELERAQATVEKAVAAADRAAQTVAELTGELERLT